MEVTMSTPRLSFEFFPPSGLDASFRLWNAVNELSCLDPSFVSVTYGAGGTTRELTHDAVNVIRAEYGLNVAAHLTCVDATRAETLEIAKRYAAAGVNEIVALRGDPPGRETSFTPHPGGFADSVDLIRALANLNHFHIRVGAYPDPHPLASSPYADVEWLKRKFDAGADSAITQFFFEADTFFRFRDKCHAAGITAPIIPGILPIENWDNTEKFAKRCGAKIPSWLPDIFNKAKRDNRHDLAAISICTELCSDLIEGGVEDLHFYTLNKPHLTKEIARALGITPELQLSDVA